MFAPGTTLNVDFSPVSEMMNAGSSNDQSPFMGNDMAQDQFTGNFDHFSANGGGDFNLFESEDLYSANVQLPTPSHEIFHNIGGFETSGMTYGADSMAHISPVGHGNAMLYTPTSLREVDEGFEDFVPNNCLGNDFQLFPSSTGGTVASSAPSALFGEIPNPMNNFAGASAQQLLDFYAASTAAVTGNHHNMDWAMDDQYTNNGYRSQ